MIEMEAKGLDDIIKKLDQLEKKTRGIRGVELSEIPRNDSGPGNETILNYLKKQGHDFITLTAAEENEIAMAFDAELQRRLDREQMDTAAVSGALRSSMVKYMDIVSDRIKTGKDAGELTENYKRWKMKTFGFETPIGVATGQLLENLNASGPGRNMIKIKR